HIPVYNGEDYAFDGITILDREVADSVTKFTSIAGDKYAADTTYTVGELFEAVDGLAEAVAIDTDNVQVFVTPADDGISTVEGIYTADTTDWTKGTIEFTGEGNATITITDYYFCTPTTIEVNIVEPVTVTMSGYGLDGATDVIPSFRGVITFPTAITTGTDLSGIVITDGTNEYALTITEGTATDGYFTTASFTTPILANGTDYKLIVPAISDNAKANFAFTTVSAPYIINEEFDNSFTGTWHTLSTVTDIYKLNELIDTDSDGVVDSLGSKGGGKHTAISIPTRVSTTNIDQLTVETRVKFIDGSNSGTAYILEDGSLKDDNDINNGGLMVVRGNNSNNYRYFISTNSEGFLTYSINKESSKKVTRVTTDYKLYANTWYTIRYTFSNDEKTYTIYVTDDEGNSINSTVKGYATFNSKMTTLSDIRYSYNAYIKATVDYLRVWDNADLGEVTSTLDGATNVAKDGATATITFTNDITEADMSKISIGNGATVVATLTDSKTVDLVISNLDWNTTYNINVPQLGENKTGVITFTTEKQPIEVIYNDVALNGAEEMPLSFNATVSFTDALEAETDLTGITINGGSVTATLADDGLSASLEVTGLENLQKYTISIPSLGDNADLDVTFSTISGDYIYRNEFNGTDAQGYSLSSKTKEDVTVSDGKQYIVNGILTLPTTAGGTTTTLVTDEAAVIKGYDKVVVETRIKFTNKDANDGGYVSSSKSLMGVYDVGFSQDVIALAAQSGKIYLGGLSDNTGEQAVANYDYPLTDGAWYTIKYTIYVGTDYVEVEIIPDDENQETLKVEKFDLGNGYALGKISHFHFSYRYQVKTEVDYIRIYPAPVVEDEIVE
ncbi:MAG: hypothetical protein J6A69_02460, partial [Clostridia bacterium]|nr:hypothetical protein [Clostridia bacterium]